MDAVSIEREALKLPAPARIRLAELLYTSVEAAEDREWNRKAGEEADSRWQAYLRGEIKAVDAQEAMEQLRSRYAR